MQCSTAKSNGHDRAIPRSRANAATGKAKISLVTAKTGTGRTPAPAGSAIEKLIQDFQSISLDDTNRLARMLKRVDNKYVVKFDELAAFFAELHDGFAVLEIEGVRAFKYKSCYFDDNYQCYYDHHQGKRLRFKVRTRHYIDSGDMFFEVKLKDKRGVTNKDRIPCKKFSSPKRGDANFSMMSKFYQKKYKKDFAFDLQPALYVNYKRCTLVSLSGGERITIDYCLSFDPLKGPSVKIGDDFIIVETKSGNGRGIADLLLKRAGIRQVKKCSKYCIGAILTGRISKFNNFRTILKRIRENIVA